MLTLSILSFITSDAWAGFESPIASASVSGKVVDSKSGQPVEYATIAVFLKSDGKPLGGTISDNLGVFKIDNLKPGNYFLKISFIGYQTLTIDDVNLVNNSDKALGNIQLVSSDKELEEVEVTAKRNLVEYKIDKKVVNLDGNVNADNGNAVDALENVPGVDVDIEGNLTLRGNSNYTVLVDGKPSSLDASEILKQTPAAMIDNIEIITNPGAKYDPDGTSGIINLVMKKQKLHGISGVLNLNVGSQDKKGTDFVLNTRRPKTNFSFGGHYDTRSFQMDGVSDRTTYNTDYDKNVFNNSFNKHSFGGGGVRFGADFYPNDKNVFSITVDAGVFNSDEDSKNNYHNWYTYRDSGDVEVDPEYIYSIEGGAEDADYINSSVNFQHNFAKTGHTFSLNAFYSFDKRQEDESLYQTKSYNADYTDVFQYAGNRTNSEANSSRARIKADYVLPFNDKNKFEAGYQGDFVNYTDDYRFDNLIDGSYVSNVLYSNNILFKRYINSLYSVYSGSFNKIGFQVGFRAEYTYRNIEAGKSYEINRPDYFPSLNFSYALPADQSLQLGYSRRINRPREWFLNPAPAYSDEYSTRIGNPDLDPEYTDAVEFNYQKNFTKAFLALETYYRHTIGSIESVSYLGDNDILVNTYMNLSNDDRFGAELSANYDPFTWFSINSSFTLERYYINANNNSSLYSTNVSEDGGSWRTKETFTFKPFKDTRIQVNLRYRGKNKTLISDNKGNFVTGMAVRQTFFNKRLSLSLDVRDIFKTMNRESTTYSDEYYLYSKSTRKSPMWSIGLSYKINNYKTRENPDSESGDYSSGETGGEL